uniref:Uncharacterized protein n=1 Tax=Mustela putorius furo TaxID=9669 RepID=M3XYG4_MUSPF
MDFKHWSVLPFLNGDTKPCLSFGSTCLEIDPNITFLCGLGLLLLFLCYLVGIPLPTRKTKTTQKRQGRAKRRRKGGTLEGFPGDRWHRREAEDTRKLISVLRRLHLCTSVSCSPLGRHHDTIHFRQLLCPDPSCEVCNSATAEINQLVFLQALEDSTPLTSTAPVTTSSFTRSPDFSAVPPGDLISAPLPKPSPPPASIFSPNPVIPVADFFAPSPPGDPLPPKPFPPLDSKFPRDHFPPQPLAFPSVQPHHAHTVGRSVQTETVSLSTTFSLDPTLSQDVSPLPELSQRVNPTETFARHPTPPTRSASPAPDCNLTVPQSKPISISRKPVPQSSPPDSSGGLSPYVSKIVGIDPSNLSILDLPWWQTHAKGFFPSTLAPRDFRQEVLALHSSEASSRGDPGAKLVEPGDLSLLSPDALALLEKQRQKRSDFLLWKQSKGSFAKQTIVDTHDLASSLPFWSTRNTSKELHMHQQRPYPTTWEEGHLQQTPIQLFWGLQTPPSESFFPAADASDRIWNASPEQEAPVVPHPLPPSLPENPPQLLPQTPPLPSPPVQPQAHLQSPIPILPSGPLPDIKICGVCLHRPRNEPENLTPAEMQHLEWNVLQKVQKRVWGLPTLVQRSQEDYCPSAPNPSLSHKATKAQVVISIPPGQFPLNEELRRKLESHLRKRLIQHRWGIPRRIYESLALMSRPSTLSQLPESQRFRGRSWIPKSPSKLNDTESISDEDSEKLHLEDGEQPEEGSGTQEHSPENGPKEDLLSDLESSSDKDMGHDSESKLTSPSENSSTVSVETVGQTKLENVLKIHLHKKSEEVSEGHLPETVHHSWNTIQQTSLPSQKSQAEITQRRLPPSEFEVNTCQELPFVEPRVQQMLESHLKRFRWRMLWGLPSRVLESIEIFKSRKATSPCSPSCSTKLIPAANSKPGGVSPLRGSLRSLHADKAGTANSASILDHPHPAASTVGKEERRIPRQLSSNIHLLVEDVPKMKHERQTLKPVKHVTIANRWPPKPPYKDANSNSSRGGQQGMKMKTPERYSGPRNFIHFSHNLASLPNYKGNEHQVKTTIPPSIPVPQDPKSLNVKEQLLHELKLMLEDREHSQAQAQYTGLPPASDHWTYMASLTHAPRVSLRDKRGSQVLCVPPEDTGIPMEQQQEPWVPKLVIRKCQNKNPPPATDSTRPPFSKPQERGGGDTGLGTSQLRTDRFPTKDAALKKRFPTQDSVLKKGQPPPESIIVQWVTPGVKCKRHENSQEKPSPLSSV